MITKHPTLGETHPASPALGDVVRCTDMDRHLDDPKGYRVEHLGWSKGSGLKFGQFAARGVAWGGLYRFDVDCWVPFPPGH